MQMFMQLSSLFQFALQRLLFTTLLFSVPTIKDLFSSYIFAVSREANCIRSNESKFKLMLIQIQL